VGELGPMFLKAGVWITKADIAELLEDRHHTLQPSLQNATKDGKEMAFEQLAALNWAQEPEDVLLKVDA
jgi:hypothetical protein